MPNQPHHEVGVGLHMAVIHEGARHTRAEFVGLALSWRDRKLIEAGNAVVANAMGLERVIHPMQMDRVRQVVAVLQGDLNVVAHRHPDGRSGHAQQGRGLERLEIFGGHGEGLRAEHPEGRVDARRHFVAGQRLHQIGRPAIQLVHLQTDMDLVGVVAAAISPRRPSTGRCA